MRRVTFKNLMPAGRNQDNLRDETQIMDLPPRQDNSGQGLPPPRLRQPPVDARPPPPDTPLSRRMSLADARGEGGSQRQPLELTDSEIRCDSRGRSTRGRKLDTRQAHGRRNTDGVTGIICRHYWHLGAIQQDELDHLGGILPQNKAVVRRDGQSATTARTRSHLDDARIRGVRARLYYRI